MADQGVSNERKKELEQMDPFQENVLKAMAYAKTYKKQILIILGAAVTVVLVFSGIMNSFRQAENRASELMAQSVDRYKKAAQDPVKAYEAVKTEFRTILDEYANTSAGKMARIKFAKICSDAKQYDQAFALYEEALDSFKGDAGFKNMLLSALGHICLAKNDLEKARHYFQQLKTTSSGLMKDDALFALAGLYDAQNNVPESRKMYEKIVEEHEKSIYKSAAETRLATVGMP